MLVPCETIRKDSFRTGPEERRSARHAAQPLEVFSCGATQEGQCQGQG